MRKPASEVESEPIREPISDLILKRASASRPSSEWNDDDYDVIADGAVVGRILKVHAAEDRTLTHGYAATREAAMATFAKSWRRE